MVTRQVTQDSPESHDDSVRITAFLRAELARAQAIADFWDRDAFMSPITILSELSNLLYNGGEPVVDDLYTREAWVEVLTAERDRLLEQADERESWNPEGAGEDRHRARRCDYLLATLGES